MYSLRNYAAAALFGVALSAALSPSPTVAASFSCMAVEDLSGAERMVCRNPALGALDERLDSWYRRALVRAGYFEQTDQVRAEQRAWLDRRNACGASYFCLRRAYKQRIRTLSNYVEHV